MLKSLSHIKIHSVGKKKRRPSQNQTKRASKKAPSQLKPKHKTTRIKPKRSSLVNTDEDNVSWLQKEQVEDENSIVYLHKDDQKETKFISNSLFSFTLSYSKI